MSITFQIIVCTGVKTDLFYLPFIGLCDACKYLIYTFYDGNLIFLKKMILSKNSPCSPKCQIAVANCACFEKN